MQFLTLKAKRDARVSTPFHSVEQESSAASSHVCLIEGSRAIACKNWSAAEPSLNNGLEMTLYR